MADCPHTIGVEFGTRIIEVRTRSTDNNDLGFKAAMQDNVP